MTFEPTEEQRLAIDLFASGDSLAIEAGAGTGKTSTLVLLGQQARGAGRRGQYLAFNKAIVQEAGAKLTSNVRANTAHSLAFKAMGQRYAHRLRGGRVKSNEIARLLGIDRAPFVVKFGAQSKVLQPGYLGSLVMRTINLFCQTADERPDRKHVPYIDGIDLPRADGTRTYANNDEVRAHLAPAIDRAWADICDRNGQLPYNHGHYLKQWQLDNPRVNADFILFDEAQDANPVMVAIVAAQAHAQLVFVGDSQQQIYSFTGAVNALAQVPAAHRTFLTQSFRFGPPIADVANLVLDRLDAELRLVGWPPAGGEVGPIVDEDVLLCRTNAAAVEAVLMHLAAGRRPHLVGGGDDVVRFARAAAELMRGERTFHPELACFETWGEVQDYVEYDPQGSELALLVKLVDDFGTDTIEAALGKGISERDADVIVSTAHKSKGREWDYVKLAGDFPDPNERDVSDEEWRLMYVAATRARRVLDVSACIALEELAHPEDAAPTASTGGW